MKKFAFVSFIILAAAFSAAAQKMTQIIKPKVVTVTDKTATASTAATQTAGEKGVRAAFDRLVEGIKQLDAEKVMSVYQNSDRILVFNNNCTATQGWAQMKTNREDYYAKIKNVSLDITGERVEMLGKDAAYLTCKWKQSGEFNGALETASGRMSVVFRLIGKDWKIVHLHTSPDNPAASRPVLPSERENQ